jgi:hypothetical protein
MLTNILSVNYIHNIVYAKYWETIDRNRNSAAHWRAYNIFWREQITLDRETSRRYKN